MRQILLTADDYRWLATLPASEREFILELIGRFDARFVDSHGSLEAWFAAELDCRHVTPEPW